jgi:hypothetical protein
LRVAVRFREIVDQAFGPLGEAIDRVRPRWTYAKGPKSRADRLPRAAAAASPAPAKVKLRFEPRALFFGDGAARPRQVRAAGLEASPPDPSKILFPAPAARAWSPRQAEVAASLRAELASFGPAGTDEARSAAAIGDDLGQALLDRAIATSTERLARMALWTAGLGAVAFAAGSILSRGADPFGFGALYFGAGFLGALVICAVALAAGRAATARFDRGQQNFSALVARTTGEFRARLIELRAAMRPTGGGFGNQVKAAGEARRATAAAMCFFAHAPALSAGSAGHQCGVLAGKLQRAARASLSAGLLLGGAIAVVAVCALAYAALQPLALAPVFAAETARPGIVLLPFAVALLLASPLLAGPMIATLHAAADPAGLLKTDPLRGLADGLSGAALSTVAETEADMIAAYADSLDQLESSAGAGRGALAHEDQPGWRRGNESPRFVGVGFHAAPPAFTADAPKASAVEKLFGGPKPKRG